MRQNPPPSVRRQQPASVTLWLLRITASAWLAQLVTQVVLAAAFVTGDTHLFSLHSANGSLMAALPFVMIILALVHATIARGRVWPLPVSVLLLVLCVTQAMLGYTRVIGAHIVGGASLLTVAALWCVGLWRMRYAPRPRRRDAAPSSARPWKHASADEGRPA